MFPRRSCPLISRCVAASQVAEGDFDLADGHTGLAGDAGDRHDQDGNSGPYPKAAHYRLHLRASVSSTTLLRTNLLRAIRGGGVSAGRRVTPAGCRPCGRDASLSIAVSLVLAGVAVEGAGGLGGTMDRRADGVPRRRPAQVGRCGMPVQGIRRPVAMEVAHHRRALSARRSRPTRVARSPASRTRSQIRPMARNPGSVT